MPDSEFSESVSFELGCSANSNHLKCVSNNILSVVLTDTEDYFPLCPNTRLRGPFVISKHMHHLN